MYTTTAATTSTAAAAAAAATTTTTTFHPSGSVNEYQLQLGGQMQVWFIPLADVRGVCR